MILEVGGGGGGGLMVRATVNLKAIELIVNLSPS